MKKNISILGSTGSIGTQTLEIARELNIQVSAISGNKNISLLEDQVREFKPKVVAVFDECYARKLKENIKDTNSKVYTGVEGLCEVACIEGAEAVVTAVSGMIGLEPTLAAINSKKDIALANKETLVAGGKLVMNAAKENNVKILPVDSEHSAIFQCLQGCENKNAIEKLILTASGGPFFGKNKTDLENVKLEDALNHPNWSMGNKITIDSATMMNKGLEIIEAVHLFDISEDQIDVVVHRESIVHSMIEYVDGSVMAQMGVPSMKIPIKYALTYPERIASEKMKLDLSKIKNLSFFEPDNITFESMDLCRKAVRQGGILPVILNAANEEAVSLFLNQKIKFRDITSIVKESLEHFSNEELKSIKQILEIDKATRLFVKSNFE